MANAHDNDRYEEAPNFNNRFKVETNLAGDVVDHRDEFQQLEYRKNMQDNPPHLKETSEGFPVMAGTVQAPKKKPTTKQVKHGSRVDQKLKEANSKDLQNRNLKN